MPRRIIDFHAHAFPDALAPKATKLLAESSGVRARLDGTIGDLLRSMDSAGIEKSVVCSIATRPAQVEPILEWSAQAASDRIVPFASIHPQRADYDDVIRRILDLGIKGVKFHPQYQDFFVDDERMFDLYESLGRARLVTVFHAGYDMSFRTDIRATPDRFARVHERFDEMIIVATHLGGWRLWEEVEALLAGTGVYFGTSFVLGEIDEELFHRILAKHDPQRVMFGTDTPWRDQAEDLAGLEALGLDDELLDALLHDNAARLLGLD